MDIRGQLRWKYLGFSCSDEERELFLRTQYSKSRRIYVVYRLLIWCYQFAWFLAYYIYMGIWYPAELMTGYRFLTRWGYFVNVCYFTLALIYVIVGNLSRSNEQHQESRPMYLLRCTTWILHSIGQSGALIIVTVYWAFVSTTSLTPISTALNIDTHGTNLVLYVIEIFVVAFPMRLLHTIYPIMFGCVYFISTVFMHVAGDVSAIYPPIDWANDPGKAAGVGIGMLLVGSVFGHFAMFSLHKLRIYVRKKCCLTASMTVYRVDV